MEDWVAVEGVETLLNVFLVAEKGQQKTNNPLIHLCDCFECAMVHLHSHLII